MFIMFCQQLLQALTEGLQLSLAREPLGAEELRDEGHGGGDLAYHGGSPSELEMQLLGASEAAELEAEAAGEVRAM